MQPRSDVFMKCINKRRRGTILRFHGKRRLKISAFVPRSPSSTPPVPPHPISRLVSLSLCSSLSDHHGEEMFFLSANPVNRYYNFTVAQFFTSCYWLLYRALENTLLWVHRLNIICACLKLIIIYTCVLLIRERCSILCLKFVSIILYTSKVFINRMIPRKTRKPEARHYLKPIPKVIVKEITFPVAKREEAIFIKYTFVSE